MIVGTVEGVLLPPDPAALRRAALAVSVLDEVDLEPYGEGVVLRGGRPVEVPWLELRRALVGAEPDGELARVRLRRHLRARRAVADAPVDELALRARPVGFPVGDPLHPGVDWVRERVLGGVLDLGLGFVGIGADPDAVIVAPVAALESVGVQPSQWWRGARGYVERMGAVAVERLRVDRSGTLRPIGDCDAVTLLASATLRGQLCAADPARMRTAAVPMRRRGWLDLRRIDPAFVLAAAAAVDLEERGFPRPVLLTADEVSLAAAGGRPAEIVLRDPSPSPSPSRLR